MNTIAQIISNTIDLAGGRYIDSVIDVGQATLYVLNTIADMELELNESTRGKAVRKDTLTITAGVKEGTVTFLPQFARYRDNTITGTTYSRWFTLPIVQDIEDLTDYENRGQKAILFTGNNAPFDYALSFTPESGQVYEIFGSADAVTEELLGETNISIAYAHLAAARSAPFVLDDLLLIDSQKYSDFVPTRKQMIAMRLRSLEHRWNVFRTNAGNDLGDKVARDYEPLDDFGFGEFRVWR